MVSYSKKSSAHCADPESSKSKPDSKTKILEVQKHGRGPSKVSLFLHNTANSLDTEPDPPPNRTQIKTRTLQVQRQGQFATLF